MSVQEIFIWNIVLKLVHGYFLTADTMNFLGTTGRGSSRVSNILLLTLLPIGIARWFNAFERGSYVVCTDSPSICRSNFLKTVWLQQILILLFEKTIVTEFESFNMTGIACFNFFRAHLFDIVHHFLQSEQIVVMILELWGLVQTSMLHGMWLVGKFLLTSIHLLLQPVIVLLHLGSLVHWLVNHRPSLSWYLCACIIRIVKTGEFMSTTCLWALHYQFCVLDARHHLSPTSVLCNAFWIFLKRCLILLLKDVNTVALQNI